MDIAPSSSPFDISPHSKKYVVFLSFRGVDTRDTFTSHLCAALRGKKDKSYIDDILERGDKVGPALLEAIEKSKISVIIFSENYASCRWCLDELVHILECKERYGQIVIPIFYGINPSCVRKQEGRYARAFRQFENRFMEKKDRLQKWRDALKEVADISGFDNSNKTGTEADFVEKIVQHILTKLNCSSLSDLKGLVGIGRKIEQVRSLLSFDSPGFCCVGIWGRVGIGKTTLADAVFHQLSSKFEASCFLANVRERSEKHGLQHLRNVLVREILKEKDLSIDTPSIGSNFVGERLRRTKALFVLDDVNDTSQLEFLVGDHTQFCLGSRIIITTRDRSLLRKTVDADKIYVVEELNSDDALQLFHLNAIKNNSTEADYYADLSRMVVDYAGGIPLALKILGSLFLQCKGKEDWQDELRELKKFGNKKIQNVLRLSYDRLEENEKEIFLDIACFYKGMDTEFSKRKLDIRGFRVRGIQILIDMSLISISASNCLEMHDNLQEMGRAIVREQCPEEPGKRNRLWDAEDVYHVLENNTGTATVQSISLDSSEMYTSHCLIRVLDFKNMYNLRLLRVYDKLRHFWYNNFDFSQVAVKSLPKGLKYLYWEAYPWQSLPSSFSAENLVELHMPRSQAEGSLWNKGQNLRHLKVINLSHSEYLTKVPDLSRSRDIEHINLCGCPLVEIPSYFTYFDKLTYLGLESCDKLKYLPQMPGNIECLDLSQTGIKELPLSVWSQEKLCSLDVTFCQALENLPSNSCKLKLVDGIFSLKGCISLRQFSELPRYTRVLDLSRTAIKVLPSSIECLFGLTAIKLKGCDRLVSLPTSICKLKSLEQLYLCGCSEFQYFPEILEPMVLECKLPTGAAVSCCTCSRSKLRNGPRTRGRKILV